MPNPNITLGDKMVKDTWKWLEEAVIGLDLCPFARPAFESGRIEVRSAPLNEAEEAVANILEELNNGKYETSLLCVEDPLNFSDFYQFCGGVEEGLAAAGLSAAFQIVAFHPGFVFERLETEDLANLVNRSPHPTIHFLKTSSIEMLEIPPERGEQVSLANEKKLKSMDRASLERVFPWNF